MVEQELCEKVNRIIRLDLIGLRECLADDETNLVLLEVADVAVLLVLLL